MTTVTCQHFDFADLLLQLRLMLKDMKEQKQTNKQKKVTATIAVIFGGLY